MRSYKWKVLNENIPIGIIVLDTQLQYANSQAKALFRGSDVLEALEKLEFHDPSS